MPPLQPHAPTATTSRGSGVAAYVLRNANSIFRVTGPVTTFSTKAYGGEVDYYIQQGLVAYARYDVSNYARPEVGLYDMNNRQWIAGVLYSLTKRGNLKLYGQYIDSKGNDLTGVETENKQAKIGVDFAW